MVDAEEIEPSTCRLTADVYISEYVFYQRSREDNSGVFGALSARNWTKFWTIAEHSA
jgi:hypothetical protein